MLKGHAYGCLELPPLGIPVPIWDVIVWSRQCATILNPWDYFGAPWLCIGLRISHMVLSGLLLNSVNHLALQITSYLTSVLAPASHPLLCLVEWSSVEELECTVSTILHSALQFYSTICRFVKLPAGKASTCCITVAVQITAAGCASATTCIVALGVKVHFFQSTHKVKLSDHTCKG